MTVQRTCPVCVVFLDQGGRSPLRNVVEACAIQLPAQESRQLFPSKVGCGGKSNVRGVGVYGAGGGVWVLLEVCEEVTGKGCRPGALHVVAPRQSTVRTPFEPLRTTRRSSRISLPAKAARPTTGRSSVHTGTPAPGRVYPLVALFGLPWHRGSIKKTN
ncbi:hypothetical protein VTJ49DRAFT_7336 [Mycothermus thermophilus]|uniref:Uncharacterized protein n=1 Tax=Humicola insolens TaxID=85995 RepID=A0ABR3VH80_HUMIN